MLYEFLTNQRGVMNYIVKRFAWWVLALFAGLLTATVLGYSTAHAAGRCLVIGDSIATHEGLGREFPECFNRARQNMSTTAITAYPPADAYDFAVVSTGSNDPLSPRLYADLAKLRERLHARRVLWVIPMHRRARQYVALEASYSHDMTQTFTPAPDGIHPLSYPSLGASIRSQLNDGTK